jgi:hypothetical protein
MRRSHSWFVRRLLFVLLCASATAASAVELVANGSFEANGGANTNTFTGWTVTDQTGGSGSFFAQTGTTNPGGFSCSALTVPAPPLGSFSAMTVQSGPGSHIISQNVAIPAGFPAKFSARVFQDNRGGPFVTPTTLDFTAGSNQQARVDIMTTGSAITDVGAGVLLNVYQTKVGDPAVAGYNIVTSDLTGFAGQTVRIRITEVDTNGCFSFGVDGVSINSAAPIPTLSDWSLIGLGFAVLLIAFVAVRRRTRTA